MRAILLRVHMSQVFVFGEIDVCVAYNAGSSVLTWNWVTLVDILSTIHTSPARLTCTRVSTHQILVCVSMIITMRCTKQMDSSVV